MPGVLAKRSKTALSLEFFNVVKRRSFQRYKTSPQPNRCKGFQTKDSRTPRPSRDLALPGRMELRVWGHTYLLAYLLWQLCATALAKRWHFQKSNRELTHQLAKEGA